MDQKRYVTKESVRDMIKGWSGGFDYIEEPVEVRHGHLVSPNPYGECSVCGMLIDIRDGFNYCPNCGAKMSGGVNL